MRDFKALLRGTKEGRVLIENESDRVVKGERIVVDNTRRKPKGGMRIIETEEVE